MDAHTVKKLSDSRLEYEIKWHEQQLHVLTNEYERRNPRERLCDDARCACEGEDVN